MNIAERVHSAYVHDRRTRVLADHLVALMPPGARILDVGCGDGLLARMIGARRSDLDIRGIDVLVRPTAQIPVQQFDGTVIPFGDKSFDVVMFVDVLHHTEDPVILLREAGRTASAAIVIKDHTRDGILAGPTLRFMDRVGNARHSVALPYNYWSRRQWHDAFWRLDWHIEAWIQDLGLYPPPVSWLFGRSLHFAARLRPST